MRGEKLWKALVLAVGISMSLTSVSMVQASTLLEDVTSTETEADHAEDISYNRLRSTNLSFGRAGITKLSSNEVNINGTTECIHTCDKIYMTLSLERKVNGVYSTYKTWDFSKLNGTNLYESINVLVPSGYYYRVSGYHAAKDDGLKESTTTLTNGILVK